MPLRRGVASVRQQSFGSLEIRIDQASNVRATFDSIDVNQASGWCSIMGALNVLCLNREGLAALEWIRLSIEVVVGKRVR